MTVEFIFVLSPNNSGTTVMGQYLQSQTAGYLPPFGNHEGQMAPAVRKAMRAAPWDPATRYDWTWIRTEWTALAEAAGRDVFIECSPPNILRVDGIRAAFEGAARYLFSISSPYAFIASTTYNYRSPPLKAEGILEAAHRWLFRAESLRLAMERHPDIPRISYEEFCRDPGVANAALGIPLRPVGELMGKKNEPVREIRDLSARHLAFLTFSEWDIANSALAERADLLAFHGYDIVPGEHLLSRSAATPALMHAGILRRARWDQKHRTAAPPKSILSRWRRRQGKHGQP